MKLTEIAGNIDEIWFSNAGGDSGGSDVFGIGGKRGGWVWGQFQLLGMIVACILNILDMVSQSIK
ncbi:hypothetical protein KY284_012795 [Solanum tuberosum]|nr:hypothetical protein KY284_012795 [Solanum tuberosum]